MLVFFLAFWSEASGDSSRPPSTLFVATVNLCFGFCLQPPCYGALPTMEMDLILFFFFASFCQRSASVCLGFNLPFWMHILECRIRIDI